MKNYLKYIILSISILITVFSCNNKATVSFNELVKWINDKDNGLIKESSIQGLKITLKYLPAQYLALREVETNMSGQDFDSLLSVYKWSHSFLMILGPDEDKGEQFDIMYLNTSGYDDYTQRVYDMNFNIKNYISLKTPQKKYSPVMTNLENVYGLNKSRNIYVVFTPQKENEDMLSAENLDFIFNDEIFNTGIHHFIFDKKDIENIPNVKIEK